MDIKHIRKILEAPYNRKVWKNFIQTQFTNIELLANEANMNLGKSEFYENCLNLGNYKLDEYNKIGIYEVILRSNVNLNRNRVGLRDLMKILVGQQPAIMVVFVQGDKWRFSYISKRKIRNKETNTVEDKETAPKRYTYLFGKGEKASTASIRFDRLIQKQQGNLYQFLTLNDFEEAFSVEKLSKEFFAQYKEIYDDFVEFITGKRYIKKGSKWVETQNHKAHFQLRNYFNNDEKQARDFFKRMMGRIVFLYFIQKKGWLACPMKSEKLKTKNESGIDWGQGDQDFMFNLYKNAKYKDSFYSEYLVPLFFDTLNNPESSQSLNQKNHISDNVFFPYLNGGLFDKSQDVRYDKIALPAEIFEKLFTTFNNYNFTIYEDAPDEHTVAVDPEMLGHIFENLLEDNKDKGAFYTPKDIVHYMCRESLHNYIYTYTGNEENEDFKTKLKQYNDTFDISIFDSKEIKLIDRALEDVKICDPAIGSGAFPMGLLHEIYHLKIPIEDSKGLKAKSPADLKKHIIEESIYGVDIDSGAVDIARLRFWLSLVVDEVAPQPLPNLAFKIVCANTLIPLGKPKSDLSGSLDIAKAIEKLRHDYFDASKEDKKDLERQFKNLQNKLWATAKDWVSKEDADIYLKITEFNPFEDKSCTWFDPWWMFGVAKEKTSFNNESVEIKQTNIQIEATNKQIDAINYSVKNSLNSTITKLQIIVANEQLDTIQEEVKLIKLKLKELEGEIKPSIDNVVSEPINLDYQINALNNRINKLNSVIVRLNKKIKPTIQKDGGYFDIVIGNPPYLDSENMVNAGNSEMRTFLTNSLKYCKGNWDIYIAFFEVGFNLLNEKGNLTFITPDKWISKPFGNELRKGLLNNFTKITEAGRKVFETAKVDSIITFVSKRQFEELVVDVIEENKIINLSNWSKADIIEPYAFDWFFSNNINLIKEIDNQNGKLLNYGICENACATSDAYKLKEIIFDLNEVTFDKQKHLKIINTGTIGRFNSKWGTSEMTYLKDKLDLTKQYKYLQPVVEKIKFKEYFTNSYYQKSIKPKLIIKGLTLLDSCIDLDGIIIPGKTTLVITNDKNTNDLLFLSAIINSKIAIFYIKQKYRGSSYNQGINFNYEMINNLPLKIIQKEEQTPFITLVDYLLYLHNKETPQILSHTDNTHIASHLEDILNMMVYELYFEEHMKEVGIDVLQFLNPKPIDSLKSDNEKAEVIKEFYEWYQKHDNAVRQRMLLVDTRSKDIIGLINKSV